MAKCFLYNLHDAFVRASDTAEKADEEYKDILDDGRFVECRVLPTDHHFNNRREYKSESCAAYRTDQRNKKLEMRNCFSEDDWNIFKNFIYQLIILNLGIRIK